MDSALATCLPIFAFMFIPVWIPIIGTIVGAICDRLLPQPSSPAEQAVVAAKSRSAEARGSVTIATSVAGGGESARNPFEHAEHRPPAADEANGISKTAA